MSDIDKTEMRQGATGHKVRHVLAISIVGSVIALAIIYALFA